MSLSTEEFVVIGSSDPIVAVLGGSITLPCRVSPAMSVENMELRWFRSKFSEAVFIYQNQQEQREEQLAQYTGRTSLVKDFLTRGEAAVRIHDVQAFDNGLYTCFFRKGSFYEEAGLELKVAGVGSAPQVHITGVRVVCMASGWFPKPQVQWRAVSGEKFLTFSETQAQDAEGLFTMEATLVVRHSSSGNVTCSVLNPILGQEKEVAIFIPDELQADLASLEVIGPPQPILVRVGEDIQLTCYLSPKTNAQSMEVRWVQSHRYPAVYVYADGGHVTEEQMEEYRGRTVLVSDAIDEGILTLQIHNATTSDNGQYRCLFEKDGVYQEASLDLKIVGLGSSPLITVKEQKDGEIELICSSEGWFPEPHVQWKDMEGKIIPSFSEVLTEDSHRLFHVETSLLVTNSSFVNVTCSISNPLLDEEKMATFFLSEPMMNFSWKIVLIWLLLLAAIVGLVKRRSCKKVNVTLDPNTAHPGLILSEGYKHVTHEHSYSHTSDRACSMDQARRGSCQGDGTEKWRLGTRECRSQVLPRAI
nr:butyrophilin-like protein 2 [Mirounga angustirostris]